MSLYFDEESALQAKRQGKTECPFCGQWHWPSAEIPRGLCETCYLRAKRQPAFAERLLEDFGLLALLAGDLAGFYAEELPPEERIARFFADWSAALAAGERGLDYTFAVVEELTAEAPFFCHNSSLLADTPNR